MGFIVAPFLWCLTFASLSAHTPSGNHAAGRVGYLVQWPQVAFYLASI